MSKGSLRFRSTAEMPDGMRKLVEAQGLAAARSGAPTPMQQLSVAEGVRAGVQPSRHVKHTSGEMNKTEAKYAQYLDALKASGQIVDWRFEAVKLRLATRAWLTIDFFVLFADGHAELHEVKGRKGNRYWAEEDAKLKVKFAAREYPWWPLLIVWPAKSGGWSYELQARA